MSTFIQCTNCHAKLGELQRSLVCPQCSANAVEFDITYKKGTKTKIWIEETGIWRYKDFLPIFPNKITLGEGNTPLRKAQNLFLDKIRLFLKIEGKNPTGSYLDRISPLMVSDALLHGMKSVICASDGNLGASLSAYCATAGIKSICVVPKTASPEKRIQIVAHGAEVIDFGETIDDSIELTRRMVDDKSYQATPEFNILNIEGTKTLSLEIVEQQKTAMNYSEDNTIPPIDYIIVPMGSGRLVYSIWKGFKQAKESGLLLNKYKLPKIIGVQVKGFDTLTSAIQKGEKEPTEINRKNKPEIGVGLLAEAILVRKSIFGEKAIQSIIDSKGTSVSVNEKEIIDASKMLGEKEGVFAELTSVTVIAGIEQLLKEKYFEKDETVLAIVTASGLKTSRAFQKSAAKTEKVESFKNMGTKIDILQKINSEENNFGYAIWKALGQIMSLQAIYQHLKELQNTQLIEEIETVDRQKKYRVTKKGKQLIQKMKELEELLS